jgi:hypothetical protein
MFDLELLIKIILHSLEMADLLLLLKLLLYLILKGLFSNFRSCSGTNSFQWEDIE